MIIANNLSAVNAHRQNRNISKNLAETVEKLNSGLKINKAADDAAGLSISQRMKMNEIEFSKCMENVGIGLDVAATAEGALNEVSAIINRTSELCVQAANGTYSDLDRNAIETEIKALFEEITHISRSTEFGGMPLFKGGVERLKETVEYLAIPAEPEAMLDGIAPVVNFNKRQPAVPAYTTLPIDFTISDSLGLIGKNMTVTDALVVPPFTATYEFYDDSTVPPPTSTANTKYIAVKTVAPEEAIEAVFNKITNSLNPRIGKVSYDAISTTVKIEDYYLKGDPSGAHSGTELTATDSNGKIQIAGSLFAGGASGTLDNGVNGERAHMKLDLSPYTGRIEDLNGKGFVVHCCTCTSNFSNIVFMSPPDPNYPKTSKINGVTTDNIIIDFSSAANIDDVIDLVISETPRNGYVPPDGYPLHFIEYEKSLTPGELKIYDHRWDLDVNLQPRLENGAMGYEAVSVFDTVIEPLNIYVSSLPPQHYINVRLPLMNLDSLGLSEDLNITDDKSSGEWLDKINGARKKVSTFRADLGADMNRLDVAKAVLSTSQINVTDALSRIQDADMAKEQMKFVKYNILKQASLSMMTQANQLPQSVLEFLK